MVVRRDDPASRAVEGLGTETIIGVTLGPFLPMTSPAESADADSPAPEAETRRFKIRMTGNAGQRRSSAKVLIERRYAWRGYFGASRAAPPEPLGTTISATESEMTIGTITVGVDRQDPILADEIFKAEVDGLRRERRRLAEFTKLATDPVRATRKVLASLFHVAYVVANRVFDCDALILEVNPRHVGYYERMLGCRVIGPERMNPRVNAPAVLLTVDFAYVREQVARFGGQPGLTSITRSLYPHFFSATKEATIVNRFHKGRILEIAGSTPDAASGPDTNL
jgi:hypothetical protein